jgi:hypothetical protein
MGVEPLRRLGITAKERVERSVIIHRRSCLGLVQTCARLYRVMSQHRQRVVAEHMGRDSLRCASVLSFDPVPGTNARLCRSDLSLERRNQRGLVCRSRTHPRRSPARALRADGPTPVPTGRRDDGYSKSSRSTSSKSFGATTTFIASSRCDSSRASSVRPSGKRCVTTSRSGIVSRFAAMASIAGT